MTRPSGDLARKLLWGGAFLGVEQVAYVALGLVFAVLLVRHVGASSFGVWSIASGMAAIAGIGTTSINLALERFVPDCESTADRAGALSLLRLVATLKITLAILLGAGLFAVSRAISSVYGEAGLYELLRLFAFWLVADSIASVGRSLLFGLQEFKFRSAMTALQGAINVISVLVAMLVGVGIAFITVGFILSTFLPGVLQLIVGLKLLRRIPVSSISQPEQVSSRRVLRYALPLTVNQGLYMLYLNMGRLILGYWLGAQAAGYFSFALNIIERLTGVVVSVSSVLLPSLVDLERRSERILKEMLAGRAVRYLSVAGAMFALVLFIFSREVTLVMGGEEFLPAALVLQVLAFQPLFRLPSQVLSTFFLVGEDTGLLLLVSVLKLLAELLGYAILIPVMGIGGAALAHVLSYLLSLALLMRLAGSRKSLKVLPMIIDSLRLCLLVAVAAAGSRVCSGLLGYQWMSTAAGVLWLALAVVGMFALRVATLLDVESLLSLNIAPSWAMRSQRGLLKMIRGAGRGASA